MQFRVADCVYMKHFWALEFLRNHGAKGQSTLRVVPQEKRSLPDSNCSWGESLSFVPQADPTPSIDADASEQVYRRDLNSSIVFRLPVVRVASSTARDRLRAGGACSGLGMKKYMSIQFSMHFDF